MKIDHVHVGLRDLPAAVGWLKKIWDLRPAYYDNSHMASFHFQSLILMLDAAEHDAPVTIAFHTEDCDAEYAYAIHKGAAPLKEPADTLWGARAAYIQGPGAITFELESPAKYVRSIHGGNR
jgi:predicted enzyme related to lactoylglutathione lyase